MKIRHIKRRARRPDFRMSRIMGALIVEVKSAAAVDRFFGATVEGDRRAAEFFAAGDLTRCRMAG